MLRVGAIFSGLAEETVKLLRRNLLDSVGFHDFSIDFHVTAVNFPQENKPSDACLFGRSIISSSKE